ncbi:MAG: hypothetical protein ACXAEU_23425 [Candidatus Hodarchaeales archaeon]
MDESAWKTKIIKWVSEIKDIKAVPHRNDPNWLTFPANDDTSLNYLINIEDKWVTCMLGPLLMIDEIPDDTKVNFYEDLLKKSGHVKMMEYAIFNKAIFCNLELDLTSCSKKEFENAITSLEAGKDYFYERLAKF